MTTTMRNTGAFKQHPPIYYTVRSLIRWTVWLVLPMIVMSALIVSIQPAELPDCPLTFNRDFTYEDHGYVEGMSCHMPYNVAIDGEGAWHWTK